MKKTLFLTSVLLAITSCSDSKTANNKNFEAAINKTLTKNNLACITIDKPFPVDVIADTETQYPEYAELEALKKVGLVTSNDIQKPMSNFFGPPTVRKVHEYQLTPEAKKIAQNNRGIYETNLCYANVVVDKIIKWTEPAAAFGQTLTTVTYTYKLENMANWAKNTEVSKAFPEIAQAINGDAKEQQNQDLILTNVGWENPKDS